MAGLLVVLLRLLFGLGRRLGSGLFLRRRLCSSGRGRRRLYGPRRRLHLARLRGSSRGRLYRARIILGRTRIGRLLRRSLWRPVRFVGTRIILRRGLGRLLWLRRPVRLVGTRIILRRGLSRCRGPICRRGWRRRCAGRRRGLHRPYLRHHLTRRGRHPDDGRGYRYGARRYSLANSRDVHRPAHILLQRGLLGGERYGRGRRRHLGDDRHADGARGRPHHGAADHSGRERLLDGCHGRRNGHRSGLRLRDLIPWNGYADLFYGPSAGEGILRHGSDRVGRGHVREPLIHGDVGDILIHVYVVIHVGDVHRVDHRGVGDIHSAEVILADLVGGSIDLARPQRHPTDRGSTDGERSAPTTAADESHQRRRVNDAHCGTAASDDHGTGNPTPTAADVGPPAIVRGREAPRGIVDPGPSPRLDPGPIPIAVGRPVGVHGGVPHRAIARRFAPHAVIIQLLVADHIGRQIAGRWRAVVTGILVFGPGFEPVRIWRVLHVVSELIGAG